MPAVSSSFSAQDKKMVLHWPNPRHFIPPRPLSDDINRVKFFKFLGVISCRVCLVNISLKFLLPVINVYI
jgi:hypothetical protein